VVEQPLIISHKSPVLDRGHIHNGSPPRS